MGILGLHKGLKFCTVKTNIREYSGCAVAVDTSSWLHKSVYSVAEKYVESMERFAVSGGKLGVDSYCVQISAKYIASRCQELIRAIGISKIYLVMDGKRCPLKADTNQERERRRMENLQEARKYKSRGDKYKAEEKYKACIKIRDQFTNAVMANVQQQFREGNRVELVWSPYEADAQLAMLCVDNLAQVVITEDSDVLVYSAACGVSFPILFKLDRGSGACDMISMDWLLSPTPPESTLTQSTIQNASGLEKILRSFADRQARRPGFGVRLFVQGCVFAGCDYAPNQLSGVGLVNAFKMIRDNAHRKNCERFDRVLSSLPFNVRSTINKTEYEDILAKSEAVFFYHVVRHADGSHRPLLPPRIESDVIEDQENDEHVPLMDRFNGDWSFLGTIEISPNTTRERHEKCPTQQYSSNGVPIREVIIHKTPTTSPKLFSTTRSTQSSITNNTTQAKKRSNPYTQPASRVRTSVEANPNEPPKNNRFSKFARKPRADSGAILKYLRNTDDVRFVKRKFPDPIAQPTQSAPPASQLFTQPGAGTKKGSGMLDALKKKLFNSHHDDGKIIVPQNQTRETRMPPQDAPTQSLLFDYGGRPDDNDDSANFVGYETKQKTIDVEEYNFNTQPNFQHSDSLFANGDLDGTAKSDELEVMGAAATTNNNSSKDPFGVSNNGNGTSQNESMFSEQFYSNNEQDQHVNDNYYSPSQPQTVVGLSIDRPLENGAIRDGNFSQDATDPSVFYESTDNDFGTSNQEIILINSEKPFKAHIETPDTEVRQNETVESPPELLGFSPPNESSTSNNNNTMLGLHAHEMLTTTVYENPTVALEETEDDVAQLDAIDPAERKAPTTSKFFREGNSRRVTLDTETPKELHCPNEAIFYDNPYVVRPQYEVPAQSPPSPTETDEIKFDYGPPSQGEAVTNGWADNRGATALHDTAEDDDDDDIVEVVKVTAGTKNNHHVYCSHPFGLRPSSSSSSSQRKSGFGHSNFFNRSTSGPLASAFQRQEELSVTATSSSLGSSSQPSVGLDRFKRKSDFFKTNNRKTNYYC